MKDVERSHNVPNRGRTTSHSDQISEEGLHQSQHNTSSKLSGWNRWNAPGTCKKRNKKRGDSKSALAYQGLTEPIDFAKVAGTLVDFVSIQALENRASQQTVTKLLAYDTSLPDLNLLLDSVDASYALLPISPDNDAITTIGAEVAVNNFQELAILCHGSSGNMNIGSNQINTNQIISR